ncbi:type I secretion system permease/ATPase [Haliovirga abyssi]|uniref:Peptidase C39 n=1 Tax=Haliovirga abyssi TaxID=2996794 RepID=A0AAU9D606_9FUSO|nr:type I secretion system permease/ATPase [Haliovirga abyssi]BDU51506.1 peptidase C39 [Haliovirga abyssi]
MNEEKEKKDTGLLSLMMMAKYHNLNTNPEQLKHAFAISKDGMQVLDILKAAKGIGLKAKLYKMSYKQIRDIKLPAILHLKDGKFVIAGKFEKDNILILNPEEGTPKMLSKEELENIWNGEIILLKPKGFKIKEEVFNIKWFIPTVWKYRKSLSEVLTASLSIQIIGLATPIVMQVIIDKVLNHKLLSALDVFIIGLFIVTIFETILKIAKNYVFTHTTNKIDVILGARLYSHLLKLPLRYFEVRRIGNTVARVREVENIRQFLTGAPLSSILDVMFIFVYFIVMFFYSSTLSWVILGSFPFFIVLSIVVTPIFKSRLDEKFKTGAEVQSYLVESVSGVNTIKSFALEPEFQKRWENVSAEYTKSGFKVSLLSGVAGALGQFIQKSTDLLVLWLGAKLVIENKITIGQLIAFRMLSSRVSGPVLRLVQMWQEFQQIGISINKLGDIFNTKPEPSIDPSKMMLPKLKGDIKFEGVRFRYRADAPEVIRDVKFEIPAGKTIGIVGRSGSGKSTLAKLVQRLYIPEAGKITVDGIDISLADPAWLRRQIGVVLQESFLFNGTIRENIAINKPTASMEEIINVARIAGAHEFIVDLPEAYDTQVGEKGSALSGGQKQRIAIARSLITNPKILIFDEATSALDYESESAIQKNLSKICDGRTVLIIAHRLSTLKDADLIMVMDRGELIEYGSPKELLSKQGLYYYLYSQQLK